MGALLIFVPLALCYISPFWGRKIALHSAAWGVAFIAFAAIGRFWGSALSCALAMLVAAGVLFGEIRLLEARIRRNAASYRLAGQEATRIGREQCEGQKADEFSGACRSGVFPEGIGARTIYHDVATLLPRQYSGLSPGIWARHHIGSDPNIGPAPNEWEASFVFQTGLRKLTVVYAPHQPWSPCDSRLAESIYECNKW